MDEVEVDISTTSGKAVIEGKTPVPFKAFVKLLLQRKLDGLYKRDADESVIVSSELLTALASAPQEKHEDNRKMMLVTFGVGIVAGVFFTVGVFLVFMLFRIQPEMKDLGIVLAVIGGVVLLAILLLRTQKKSVFADKLYESMEKLTDMISK
jgi:hypothetical protein